MQHSKNQAIMESESGYFYVDENGIAQRFILSEDNLCINESIRTFVAPEGIKGFRSDFLRGIRVIERFELPESLVRIGNNSFDSESEETCVFANCILPTVVIPDNVREIGIFAFGHSYINTLQLPISIRSPYGRQFKDSHINVLRLPYDWKDSVELNRGQLVLKDSLQHNDYGYLNWPSTFIGKLEWI